MKLYVQLDETYTQVLSVSTTEDDIHAHEVEADATINLSKLEGYKIEAIDGVNHLVFDEEQFNTSIENHALDREHANAEKLLANMMRYEFLQKADDETAFELKTLYPAFAVGASQTKGMKLQYNGKLYKVIAETPFAATAEWTPDAATSLYVEISGEEYPEFVAPSGANPFMKGDKVSENGKKYICIADYTVWAPSATPERWAEVAE